MTTAVNTSSNLGIQFGIGIVSVADMIARSCRVALGIDSLTLDEDHEALREMCLLNLLHGEGGSGALLCDRSLPLTDPNNANDPCP